MDRQARVFWASAVLVALGFAAAAYLLMPYGLLRADTAAERHHVWLLTLWTAGVFGMLFGLSALLGAFRGIGVREVHEAGGAKQAVDRHQKSMRGWGGGGRFHANFGWWTVSTGALLVLVYFAAWAAGG
jgi:hypothetical protein